MRSADPGSRHHVRASYSLLAPVAWSHAQGLFEDTLPPFLSDRRALCHPSPPLTTNLPCSAACTNALARLRGNWYSGVPTSRPLVVGLACVGIGHRPRRACVPLCRSRDRDPAERVAFAHIDCDIYSSAATVLRLLSPRICAGSVIVFDEWCGYPGWELHEAKAWQEFQAQHGMHACLRTPGTATVLVTGDP